MVVLNLYGHTDPYNLHRNRMVVLNSYGHTDPYNLHRNRGPYIAVRTVLSVQRTNFLRKLGLDFEEVDCYGFQESFVLGKER
jgi:hypothetical protein